jgi:hypothetical protein
MSGAGLFDTRLDRQISVYSSEAESESEEMQAEQPKINFYMCGYSVPQLDIVQVGFAGIGDRISEAVERKTYRIS